ncbi:MAG: hypothetical protein AAF561_00875 [Planctomycetota bacterium]
MATGPSSYPIISVDRGTAVDLEQLGTKSKFWFRDEQGRRTLFKANRLGSGEDWAEKIACELASLLGLPHVHYEMAHERQDDVPGVVCRSCVRKGQSLVHGNELLLAKDPDYPADGSKYHVSRHTISIVRAAVRALAPPTADWVANVPPGVDTAGSGAGVFVGYLMLDAWTANQDRHHENWAAIRDGDTLSLAPSFDHGSCLARNLDDAEREQRLASKDRGYQVSAFARRAKSALYADETAKRPLSPEAAWRAFAAEEPDAAVAWLDVLGDLEDASVAEVVRRVPASNMTDTTRTFTLKLLQENQRRLLDRRG